MAMPLPGEHRKFCTSLQDLHPKKHTIEDMAKHISIYYANGTNTHWYLMIKQWKEAI
jgi:hypothetical protein